MRLRSCLAIALVWFLSGLVALAQTPPTSTVRTVLATGRVGSVLDTPLAFRLLSVRLPPTQQASYTGPNAMVYSVSGSFRLERAGNSQIIAEGGGAFIPEGLATTFSNATQELTNFLLFIL